MSLGYPTGFYGTKIRSRRDQRATQNVLARRTQTRTFGSYLDLKLVALSTTFTTRLPPVLAHPVYHPHIKAKPFGCSASLRSLDMGWCVEPGPHREGTRSRRCGRRLTETLRGRLTSGRRDRGDRFGDSN